MRKFSILQRIAACFGVFILILAGCGGLTWWKLSGVERQALAARDDDALGMYLAGVVRSRWAEHMVMTQQLLLQQRDEGGDPAQAARAMAQIKDVEAKVNQAAADYPSTVTLSEDRAQYDLFVPQFRRYKELHAELLRHIANQHLAEALRLNNQELLPAWNNGRESVSRMIDLNKSLSEHSVDGILSAVEDTRRSVLGAAVLCLAAALACGLALMRSITQPVGRIVQTLEALGAGDLSARMALKRRDEFNAIEVGFNKMADELKTLVGHAQRSAVQISTSITQIAATSRQQQASATESAASTAQIGATSREIAHTAKELVKAMAEVSDSARQTSVLAGAGQHGLERMAEVMHHVLHAAEVVNGKLATLNEKAGNITQVVTTIVKVADQTNLLSLNASIEAEKAGEYGRGFAVVATEVRRLADQTAVATYDIEQMVREMQAAVAAGVMGMDKFAEEVRRSHAEVNQVGDQLTQIIQQVQKLSPQVQMVNDGVQAQATGAVQIKQALMLLSDATGQTHESLRQAGASIDELNQVAGGLRTSVSRFKV